jgi:GxxExxY protein
MLEAPNEKQFPDKEIAQQIIGSAFEVSNHLGHGYLEKVYQRAMQA